MPAVIDDTYAEAFRSMWEHLLTINRETGHTLEHINLGGGIPVNYLRDRSQADQFPEHERDMFAVAVRDACGCIHRRILDRETRGVFDALFDFAHAREVLIQLLLVATVEPGVHGARR